MSDQISLTLPITPSALTHAAGMLLSIADELSPVQLDTTQTAEVETPTTAGKLLDAVDEVETPPAPEVETTQAAPPNPEEVFGADPTTQTEATVSIELDKAGLPWDVRIHASSKTKLAKTQQWKKKRGVDQALVDQVEAELRAAMAIPAPDATTQAPAANPPAPEIPEAGAEIIDTFPKLMQAITAKGIDPDTVQGAVAAVGLASLPLVATRPDLIPQVAAGLGI